MPAASRVSPSRRTARSWPRRWLRTGSGLLVVLELHLNLLEEAHVVVGELVGHLGGPAGLVAGGHGVLHGDRAALAPLGRAQVDDVGMAHDVGAGGARGHGRRAAD